MSELAIHGGPPVRTVQYPAWPEHDDRERELLLDVLDSRRWWSTQGTRVHEFEHAWGELHGTGPAVAVTNGSHAIEVALLATGIGQGDEVIVPSWTFVATAASVLMVNASPVLVDVELGTGCIDPDAVEAAITERTRAVIAVHIAGHPADMERLTEICARRDLVLIEDCAHAHGSLFNGQMVGTFGSAGTYSFQASKLMTGGEGGAIVTTDPEVRANAASYSDCGRRPGEWFYSHFALGGNYRMTEWQGAVLLAQLDQLRPNSASSTGRRSSIERCAAAPVATAHMPSVTVTASGRPARIASSRWRCSMKLAPWWKSGYGTRGSIGAGISRTPVPGCVPGASGRLVRRPTPCRRARSLRAWRRRR
jgi:dTDP-4-amino-4,6-dideoxygalactose transaminase